METKAARKQMRAACQLHQIKPFASMLCCAAVKSLGRMTMLYEGVLSLGTSYLQHADHWHKSGPARTRA